MTARTVSARAREMGIRTALGAEANGLIRLVLRDGLLTAVLGLGLGLLVAWGAAGFVAHLVFEVDARDPWTFAGAAILSLTVCDIAGYVPARRAASIDPMEVLVEE